MAAKTAISLIDWWFQRTRTLKYALTTQQQFFTSQRDLVKARYDTQLAGLKLKAAADVLTEADVLGINGLLVR